MHIDGLLQLMRREALKVMGEHRTASLAYVKSYDPNTYTAKVILQPWGIESGWLPIGALAVGDGWGIYAPPSAGTAARPGDQVTVVYVDGEPAFISHRIFFGGDPLTVPSGEVWVVHESGSFIKLTNDGALALADANNNTVVLNTSGVTITGPAAINIVSTAAVNVQAPTLTVSGNLTVAGNITAANIAVSGAATGGLAVEGGLSVAGATAMTGALAVSGAVTIGTEAAPGNLIVNGTISDSSGSVGTL